METIVYGFKHENNVLNPISFKFKNNSPIVILLFADREIM